MFGRRKKSIADSAAKLLNGSPAAPSIDDIAADLESAAADDPVFVREVPRAESALVQEIVDIRERFEEEAGEKSEGGDVFDKIIESRINLERVRTLEKKLEEGVEAVERTAAEVKGDVERLRAAHEEVAAKFNEAKEAKEFEKERTRRHFAADQAAAMEFSMTVPFRTARHAEIAYDSLRVDPEPRRGGTKRRMEVEGALLRVRFTCAEAKTLRVSVNSFFDLLHLVNETIEQFDERKE